MSAADFYTGLVADLYRPLRSGDPDPSIYQRFIAKNGEPALELGCGDGDPMLALRQLGLDVDGLDVSQDMLDRAAARAATLGLPVTLFNQPMESMDLPRRYRSIFLAGPTFNLLADDDSALRALHRIAAHLEADGCALVPLFLPDAMPEEHLGRWREDTDDEGRTIRFTNTAQSRDEARRLQTTTLRYERITDSNDVEFLERDFVIHWYTQDQFRALATEAGLNVVRRLPDDDAAPAFAFWLRRSA